MEYVKISRNSMWFKIATMKFSKSSFNGMFLPYDHDGNPYIKSTCSYYSACITGTICVSFMMLVAFIFPSGIYGAYSLVTQDSFPFLGQLLAPFPELVQLFIIVIFALSSFAWLAIGWITLITAFILFIAGCSVLLIDVMNILLSISTGVKITKQNFNNFGMKFSQKMRPIKDTLSGICRPVKIID